VVAVVAKKAFVAGIADAADFVVFVVAVAAEVRECRGRQSQVVRTRKELSRIVVAGLAVAAMHFERQKQQLVDTAVVEVEPDTAPESLRGRDSPSCMLGTGLTQDCAVGRIER